MELCYSFNGGHFHREDVKSCCFKQFVKAGTEKINGFFWMVKPCESEVKLKHLTKYCSNSIITCTCKNPSKTFKNQVFTPKATAVLDKNVRLSFTQQVKAECFSSNAWQCAWTPSHPVKVSLRPSLPSCRFMDSWFMAPWEKWILFQKIPM